eukprot:jgi/Mesvir1/25342/Mv14024-RA.1
MASYCCQALCLPCKAINALCDASCDGVRLCCKGACEGISLGCSALCYPCKLLCPDNAPSPIFLSYTWLVNIPLLVASLVIAVMNLDNKCEKSIPGFLFGIAVASAFFCAFSVHTYRALSGPAYSAAQTSAQPNLEAGNRLSTHANPTAGGTNNLTIGATMLERGCTMCMYDPWVFAYLIVALFAIIWSSLGLTWTRERKGCVSPHDDDLLHMARVAGSLMLFYIFFSVVVVGCSLLVNCCRITEQPEDNNHYGDDRYNNNPGGAATGAGVQQRPPGSQRFGTQGGAPGTAASAPPFNPFAGLSSGLIGRAFGAPGAAAGSTGGQAGAGSGAGVTSTSGVASSYAPAQEQPWSLPAGFPPAPARAPMQPPRGPTASTLYGAAPSLAPPLFATQPAPYVVPPAPQGYIDLSQTPPPPVLAPQTAMGYPAPYGASAPPMPHYPQYPPPPNRA